MTLPPLPEPDTHCFDDDTGLDVWSHSPDQMRAYGEVCAVAERERCAKIVDLPPGTEAWEVIGGEEGLTMLRELATQIRGPNV